MDKIEEALKKVLKEQSDRISHRTIYISHPYGGNEENKEHIETIIKQLIYENPQHTYISPVHTFGFLYTEVEYEAGINMCLNLLDMCDEMCVYGDWQTSKGCKIELKHAIDKGKPFKIM